MVLPHSSRPLKHSHRYDTQMDLPYWKTAPHVDAENVTSLGQYRWDPMFRILMPQDETWLTGMRTMTTAGDVNTQAGMASHIYLVTATMHGG